MTKYITNYYRQSFYTGGRFINMLNQKIILSNAVDFGCPNCYKKKGFVMFMIFCS